MGALLKLIPLPVLISILLGGATLFGFKGWWNAYQDNKQLVHENKTLLERIEAREKATAFRAATLARIDQRFDSSIKAIQEIPDDGCLDRAAPDGVKRLFSEASGNPAIAGIPERD